MIRYAIYVAIILVVGCTNGSSHISEGYHEYAKVETKANMELFRYPDIPSMITDDEERMRYFTEHYWDNYNFADSLLIHNDSISGSAMAGYISLLELNDTTTVRQSIEKMLQRGITESYDNFLEFTAICENYLYDPNSPVRNEELYIVVLQSILNNNGVAEVDKIRPQQQLNMALRNRVGELSADFEYTLNSGEKREMHNVNAKYTILFFNSPDCEECGRVKQFMNSSKSIMEACHSGDLKILALYPDTDIELWRNTEYPTMIINGYDDGQTITKNRVYDLRAIPTLYLLDHQKRVLIKDGTIEEIEVNLRKIFSHP